MSGSFGQALSVIALLAGCAAMLRGWWARRKGRDLTTPDDEKRRASAVEMERRMASYLAGRDAPKYDVSPTYHDQSGKAARGVAD